MGQSAAMPGRPVKLRDRSVLATPSAVSPSALTASSSRSQMISSARTAGVVGDSANMDNSFRRPYRGWSCGASSPVGLSFGSVDLRGRSAAISEQHRPTPGSGGGLRRVQGVEDVRVDVVLVDAVRAAVHGEGGGRTAVTLDDGEVPVREAGLFSAE